jgi:hypothetical protein
MLADRNHLSRPVRIIGALIFLYGFFWIKGWPRQYDDEELSIERPQPHAFLGPHRVDRESLVVSVTTTANDVYAKVAPLLLNTPHEYHSELLLFSDLQAEVGKWPVFDVVWRYGKEFVLAAEELGRYRTQVDAATRSIPLQNLKKSNPEEEKKDMVVLDKYKVLQSMVAAWNYRPGRSWYAFVGDETYINRPNLLDYLSQYDPKTMQFFGNPPMTSTAPVPDAFAAGGTSFIVSREVMRQLFDVREHLVKDWMGRIADHTSAFDLIFNILREELKVGLKSVWPGVSGFNPGNAPFSPALWCEPVIMMHHVSPHAGSKLRKLEQDTTLLRFSDLWQQFMIPENLNYTRDDWDNLSSESSNGRWNILFEGDQPDAKRARNGEESPEACDDSCNKMDYCVQWSYSSIPQMNWNENRDTKCHLSASIRFGAHAGPQELDVDGEKSVLTWKSGWKKGKFNTWARQQRCKAQYE